MNNNTSEIQNHKNILKLVNIKINRVQSQTGEQ
jgi:hypothetical protein